MQDLIFGDTSILKFSPSWSFMTMLLFFFLFFFFPSHFIYLFFLSLYSSLILVSHTHTCSTLSKLHSYSCVHFPLMFVNLSLHQTFLCSVTTYTTNIHLNIHTQHLSESNRYLKFTKVRNTILAPAPNIFLLRCPLSLYMVLSCLSVYILSTLSTLKTFLRAPAVAQQ